MTEKVDLFREAVVCSRYLISAEPSSDLIARYARAIAARLPQPPDRVVRLAIAVPMLLGPLDAGAALIRPHHQLRQRLLLLTAILESSPDHTRKFLSRHYSRWEAVRLAAALAVTVPLRALIGVPLFILLDRPGRQHV